MPRSDDLSLLLLCAVCSALKFPCCSWTRICPCSCNSRFLAHIKQKLFGLHHPHPFWIHNLEFTYTENAVRTYNTSHWQMLMSRASSPGGSSCAEPDEQLVCNFEASEIHGAPVTPAPSPLAGVACTSSDCNQRVSVAHEFPSLELGFLFSLAGKE